MDPNAFVAEVYRRMAVRHAEQKSRPNWEQTQRDPTVRAATQQYAPHLPKDKNARILDIGFGEGWFLAACLNLGYSYLCGAEFGIAHKAYVRDWAPDRITLWEIRSDIGDFLRDKREQFDFIHMSHVIEHIPKYSLFWVVDALYFALKPGGSILLRTPNMEGPCANSSLYVTLAHEYGFAGSNLASLLDICGFDDVRFLRFPDPQFTLKQRLGKLLRWPYLKQNQWRHRLFGVNHGGQFGAELIVTARRNDFPPYFDPRYR
jgi:2-polyprenyl-3-methyl-5-hydroxy-6-metoxy-1,4-benzoquinol methylase